MLGPSYVAGCVTLRADREETGALLCTYRLEALTFCHSMMRMMSEMTVRTTKARMAEITTTLKGRAEDRDQRSHKQTAAGSCSPPSCCGHHRSTGLALPSTEALTL